MPTDIDLLLDRLHNIEERLTTHGQENRNGLAMQTQEMRASFTLLGQKLDAHERDDQLVADRVLILEEDRRGGLARRQDDRERVNRQVGMLVTGINLVMGLMYFIGRMVWESVKH